MLALLLAACAGQPWVDEETSRGCPTTLEAAETVEVDAAAYLGVGSIVRFIDSSDREYRGYEIEINRTITGRSFMNVALLRLESEVEGLEQGQAVLVVAVRPGPDRVLTPGRCPPLIAIDDPFAEED